MKNKKRTKNISILAGEEQVVFFEQLRLEMYIGSQLKEKKHHSKGKESSSESLVYTLFHGNFLLCPV